MNVWECGVVRGGLDGLHLAHEIRLEAARGIVPLEAFAIAIPQFQAVLLLPVLVAEIVWFACIPVGERDGSPGGHPEVVALVGQISAGYPEMLVAQTCERRERFENRFANSHAHLQRLRVQPKVFHAARAALAHSLFSKLNAARDGHWPVGRPLSPSSSSFS